MGSGRGDRNQVLRRSQYSTSFRRLQWGPVVVTGISTALETKLDAILKALQWGPVVVTGIRARG